MKYAHYYGSKTRGYTLRITDGPRPIGGTEYHVSGKSEARKLAAQHGATPYNF